MGSRRVLQLQLRHALLQLGVLRHRLDQCSARYFIRAPGREQQWYVSHDYIYSILIFLRG